MKVVVAIDSFKGCLTSQEASQAAAMGIHNVCPMATVVQVPVSDGGEGFVNAFRAAMGGQLVELTVSDPLLRPVVARYLMCERTAVVEVAQACGLTLLRQEERNPMVATSFGVGQLVADAVRRGADHVIVGLGGSATSDAGIGMIRALIHNFAPRGKWDDVKELHRVRFTIASDVSNPLCGPHGAAYTFAPQKFSAATCTDENIRALDRRAKTFADVSARHFGYDCSCQAGAGAAGGLGYAFMQYLHAESKSGVELLLDVVHFTKKVEHADLIITGEGSADSQTLMGKLPLGIVKRAGSVPVCLIAGHIANREALLQAGFAWVECITPEGLPLRDAMRSNVAQHNICHTVARVLSAFDHKP